MNVYTRSMGKAFRVLPYFGGWVAMGALPFMINRDEYKDRLRAMWAAEALANWTGLRTEIQYNDPPFLTDNDWGKNARDGQKIEFAFQDPWQADDDTDIEYVYLEMLSKRMEYERLSRWTDFSSGAAPNSLPIVWHDYSNFVSHRGIGAAWEKHINRYIWVSNDRARELIGDNVLPPGTGLAVANPYSLMIDAQLTTEFFGAVCPGMPEQALIISDLPIRTTSSSFATHAAQFHVLLYSHAAVVDQSLPLEEQVLWIVDESRQYIPDSSKTAEIVDFVRADYLANPDKENWELTRDRIYERYHRDAAANGYIYRGKFESSVNFATGVMALVYGRGSFGRTIQIGTLSGWDSDNPTATMGGVLGLMRGYDALTAEFGRPISDRFNAFRTRDNLPDYLPNDSAASDTFTMMAERMLVQVDLATRDGGGRIENNVLLIPKPMETNKLSLNPVHRLYTTSANNQQLAKGKVPKAFASSGNNLERICDGIEFNFSGRDVNSQARTTTIGGAGEIHWVAVVYEEALPIAGFRMVRGEQNRRGGEDVFMVHGVLLLIDGRWIPLNAIPVVYRYDPPVGYNMIGGAGAWESPVEAQGIWLAYDGANTTCAEFDAILAE